MPVEHQKVYSYEKFSDVQTVSHWRVSFKKNWNITLLVKTQEKWLQLRYMNQIGGIYQIQSVDNLMSCEMEPLQPNPICQCL